MTVKSKPKTVRKPDSHALLEIHMKEIGVGFVPEYRFHGTRKWRFDYLVRLHVGATNSRVIAVEIEGGIWSRGRHTRGAGFARDLEKYREATRMGYDVYRFSTQEVLNGTARHYLENLERD